MRTIISSSYYTRENAVFQPHLKGYTHFHQSFTLVTSM